MKIFTRFLLFCFLAISLILLPITQTVFDVSSLGDINATYFYFTSGEQQEIKSAHIIQNGVFEIVCCDFKNATSVKKQLNSILGESVRINVKSDNQKNLVIKNFAKNIVSEEIVDDYTILNCYDSKLPRYVLVDGKKVNIQIAISKNFIDVGYPLILNGF